MPRETRVLLVGLMASGKSTIGAALADATGWREIDNDMLLREMCGMTAAELSRAEGEKRLRAAESEVLHQVLHMPPPLVAGVAAGAVLDPGDRERLQDDGAHVVWLKPSVDTIISRVAAQPHRPWVSHDPDGVVREMARVRYPLYTEVADQVLDLDHLTPDQAAQEILQALSIG